MPRIFGIVPIPRYRCGWQPSQRPREGFYLRGCGYVHDDNGYAPPKPEPKQESK